MHARILLVNGRLCFSISCLLLPLRKLNISIESNRNQKKRLKVSLALPKIQPRPPCPPRTYQKLYRYLDGALSTASPRRSTRFHDDSRNKKDDAPSTPSRSAGLKPGTPTQQKNSEEKSLGKLKRPSVRRAAAVSAAGNRNEKQGKEEDLVPQWVMPAIRVLCKKLGASAAPPHIYTGVSSILTLAAPISRTYRTAEGGDHEGKSSSQQQARALGKSSAKIPALIVAVGLIVFTCLSGKSTPPAEYARQKILGLDSLKGYFSQSVPAPGGAGREELLKTVGDGDGLSFDNPADVDEWLREIRDRGWTRLDWFKNVGQGTGLTVGDGGEDENGDQDKDEEGAHSVGDEENEEEDSWTVRRGFEEGVEEGEYLQAGLGTMVGVSFYLFPVPRPHTYIPTTHAFYSVFTDR